MPPSTPPLTLVRSSAPLTMQQAVLMAQRLTALRQAGDQAILTPDLQTRIQADYSFTSTQLLAYAEQLLQAWFVVHREYLPLIQALAVPIARSRDFLETPPQVAPPPSAHPPAAEGTSDAPAAG